MSAEVPRFIKCVVWDLDDTLWRGVLMEGDSVTVPPEISAAILEIDRRGILQSIASHNNRDDANERLKALGLHEYFLSPRFGWADKAESVAGIARDLGIGLDSILFLDDQPEERDNIQLAHPKVRQATADQVSALLSSPELNPPSSEDGRRRRELVRAGVARRRDEDSFVGTHVEFLRTLDMHLTIAPADEADLDRAHELTVRTHQLNSTGRPYPLEALRDRLSSDDQLLWMCSLADRYGPYGRIGLVLIERSSTVWTIKLLLLSCRVLTRNLGFALLAYVIGRARAAGVRVHAEFIATDRNRAMLMAYRLSGFKPLFTHGNYTLYEHDFINSPVFPDYMKLTDLVP